jgi:hypothetical protein
MPRVLVTYSAHALRRMRERGIPQRFVEQTLAAPDRMFIGVQGHPMAEGAFGFGTMRVVFVDRLDSGGRQRHVITVMWR